jgi:hypothetical protein
MTLDQAFVDLADSGWLLNTLCQNDAGVWFCNLRHNWHFTPVVSADTASLALALALDSLDYAKHIPQATTSHSIETKPNLAALLNLKAARPIRRL